MFQRLCKPLLSNSFFIFGARGTGKTKLLEHLFTSMSPFVLDFLNDDTLDPLRRRPGSLLARYEALSQKPDWIVIDEVQRAPKILNTVHKMIEKHHVHFALTGSSARKLKRGAANLLAGRAFVYHLFPLTFVELADAFQLSEVLRWGSLPKIFSYDTDLEKTKYLRAYAHTYLREEIMQEQAVRKLEPFREFLEVSAQMDGKILNFSKIAKDVGVDHKTVATYFQILESTYMGFVLPSYHRSIRKAQSMTAKFYWFDLGVRKALENTLDFAPAPGTSYYGECFEHLVINEIFRLNQYSEKGFRLSYFSTHNSDREIDLVLEKGRGRQTILIEIKSTHKIDEKEVDHLRELKKDFPSAQAYYLSQCTEEEHIDGISCLFWQHGVRKILGIDL